MSQAVTVTGLRKSYLLFSQDCKTDNHIKGYLGLRTEVTALNGCGRDFRQLLEAASGLPLENPAISIKRPTGTPERERRASHPSAAADLGRAAG